MTVPRPSGDRQLAEHPREIPPRARTLFETVFIGPEGVRAGWRAGLYIALVLVLMSAAQLAFRAAGFWPYVNARDITPAPIFVQELILFLSSLGATAALGLIEGHSLAYYGLPWEQAFRSCFWQGTVWGFSEIAVLIALMATLGGYLVTGMTQNAIQALGSGVLWAGVFLAVGFGEEFAFRGYLLRTLRAGVGFWPAAVVSSIGFAAVHLGNPGESWPGLIAVAGIGIFFCFTVLRTGNLWFAVGAHAAFDFGQAFIYAVPNSGTLIRDPLLRASVSGPVWLTGGADGPEGSYVSLLILPIMFIIFARIYRQRDPPKQIVDQSELR